MFCILAILLKPSAVFGSFPLCNFSAQRYELHSISMARARKPEKNYFQLSKMAAILGAHTAVDKFILLRMVSSHRHGAMWHNSIHSIQEFLFKTSQASPFVSLTVLVHLPLLHFPTTSPLPAVLFSHSNDLLYRRHRNASTMFRSSVDCQTCDFQQMSLGSSTACAFVNYCIFFCLFS